MQNDENAILLIINQFTINYKIIYIHKDDIPRPYNTIGSRAYLQQWYPL